MQEFYIYISHWLDPFFLIYFSMINITYTILLILGSVKIYQRRRELSIEDFTYLLRANSLPTIAFLVPAYNEEKNITAVVDNLKNLSYRRKKIIVINDGSLDLTFQLLKDRYDLVSIPRYYDEVIPTKPVRGIYRSLNHPEIIVIDKENGQKYDALNAGLNACKDSNYVSVDADTFIDDEGFEALIRPILSFPETIATGAGLRIRNGCILNYNRVDSLKSPVNYISAMQSLEYLRAFLMRQGWDYMGGNYVLSGAFSVFRTDAVKWVRGYAPTVADDLEIILRLNRVFMEAQIPYKIKYLPDPTGWTECPSTLKTLGRQRFLWHRGTMEAAWFNKKLFGNPKFGRYGLFVYPFLIFGEIFEPIVECMGYIYIALGLFLGAINAFYLLLLLATIWGFVFIFTFCCLIIEELSFRKFPTARSVTLLFLYNLIENIGYIGFFKRYKDIKADTTQINKSVEEILTQKRESRNI